MITLTFTQAISAPADKVWQTLWNDTTYRHWTSVFSPGCYAVSDWKEGSRAHFLTPEGDGMYADIQRVTENKLMDFRHLGMVKNFEEQPADESSQGWSGAKETYTLSESGGITTINLSIDVVPEFESYFREVFPRALELVKQLAEEKIKPVIIVLTSVEASAEKVWNCWTEPAHITQWCFATDEWHAPRATNDLKTGGVFTTRMEARDGSTGFDFAGTYTNVEPMKHIAYTMEDGRSVTVDFSESEGKISIVESFHPENTFSHEMQRSGWQSILDNFRKYVEGLK